MIVDIKEIFKKAKEGKYAVGAFNTVNLETTRAIVEAAREMRSPVVIQITERTMEYAGGRLIYNLIKNDVEFYAPEVPVAIHLDHGKSQEIVYRAVDIGLGSVMFDGSEKQFEDNLRITKEIVKKCHEKNVAVQGELGSIPYIGEGEISDEEWDKYMTDPGQAAQFVKETGIDSLAVAIGNAHGFFRERSQPDYPRLEMINKLTEGLPLILHGASDWNDGRVKEVISRGVVCFNVDTAIRVSFINSLISASKSQEGISFDIRKSLGDARDATKRLVMDKIKLFGSDQKI